MSRERTAVPLTEVVVASHLSSEELAMLKEEQELVSAERVPPTYQPKQIKVGRLMVPQNVFITTLFTLAITALVYFTKTNELQGAWREMSAARREYAEATSGIDKMKCGAVLHSAEGDVYKSGVIESTNAGLRWMQAKRRCENIESWFRNSLGNAPHVEHPSCSIRTM